MVFQSLALKSMVCQSLPGLPTKEGNEEAKARLMLVKTPSALKWAWDRSSLSFRVRVRVRVRVRG